MSINLSEPFIRRPIMTTLVMLAILFFGILAYRLLPVSDLPNVDSPTISVSASYPGADPETMANAIATPLEKQLISIDGLETISSSSSRGDTSIILQFSLKKKMIEATQDVQSAINRAMSDLPEDLPSMPTYSKSNASESPILYYALTSESMDIAKLRDYAENVFSQQIGMISGVSKVEVYGSDWAVRVQLDPIKLSALNISIPEVKEAIKESSALKPTGKLKGPKRIYTITVPGQIEEAKGYEDLVIKSQEGVVVRLNQVGRAFDSLSNDKSTFTLSQEGKTEPCVIMAVQKQPGENTLAVIEGIKKVVPKLREQLPGSVKLHTVLDKTQFIEESVQDVQRTLLIAFFLVVSMIFIYLGRIKDTIIPACALPMCVIGTFAIMALFGFSIDVLSLLALTLSIGFLVDDAIVVLENIVRHVEQGVSPFKAALDGSKEISFTILSMTLCLAAVFLPMAFLGGVVGRLFREFSVVIISSVLISGAVSLTLTPMLASRFIPEKKEEEKESKLEHFSKQLNAFLVKHYKTTLLWSLKHKKTVLSLAFASLGGAIFLFNTLPKDFLPGDDIGVIRGFVQTLDGTSADEMIRLQNQATALIQDDKNFKTVVSVGAVPSSNQGFFFLALTPPSERPSAQEVIQSLQARMSTIPGLQAFFTPLPLISLGIGEDSSGSYQYTVQSLDTNVLYQAAPKLFEKMKTLPGFTQIKSDMHLSQPLVALHIDRNRAASLGVSVTEIENTLSLAYGGAYVTPITKPDGQFFVIMELLPSFVAYPQDLANLSIRSRSGQLIPLNNLMTVKEGVGPVSINHLNGLPSVTLSFNLLNIPLSTALDTLNKTAEEVLPPEVRGSVQGAANVFESSFANLTFLLLVTIFVIYVILGILYENFFHPITVMSTLPPAAFGALLVLLLFHYPFSLYAFVGVIMLLGIVLKNGIILVDFANVAIVQERLSPHEAIVHAATTRFRPILMTTISALVGALPIAIGIGGVTAEGRRPLGLVVVGGLIISQILTLYFTPVVYLYLESLKEWLFSSTDAGGRRQTPPR